MFRLLRDEVTTVRPPARPPAMAPHSIAAYSQAVAQYDKILVGEY